MRFSKEKAGYEQEKYNKTNILPPAPLRTTNLACRLRRAALQLKDERHRHRPIATVCHCRLPGY
jgi:hypothetical protein